jgi:hypothetical protein
LGSGGAAALGEDAAAAGAWHGGGGATRRGARLGGWRSNLGVGGGQGEAESTEQCGRGRDLEGAAVGVWGRWEIGFVVFFIGLLVFWAAVIWAQCVRCVVAMFLS